MTDETRNLEVECAPANWDAPPPSADFHERMLSAYDREFRGAPLWRRCLGIRVPLPIAVAAVLGAFFLAFFIAPHLGRQYTGGPRKWLPPRATATNPYISLVL